MTTTARRSATALAAAGAMLLLPVHDHATAAPPAAVPAWFQPIARYYHHNPRIGPGYDFASLYAGARPIR